jgi:transglutaminase-like putative cysteine protease
MAMPRQDLYKLIRVSLIMPVVALALMVVFFFVLPRTRQPMWNFLNPGNSAKSGLAESVEPGSYARISSNGDLAFRAEMEELAPEDLYWRAMVLNRPDGQSWIRVPPPREKARPVNSSRAVETKIFADSSNDQYLFTLDYPTMLSGLKYQRHDDSVFMASRRLDRPYQLQMVSHVGAELAVTGPIDEAFYLALPTRISTRMMQLATGITNEEASRQERINRLANFFRTQQLVYAQDDLPSGADAIDAFLFDKKRGYCEFFASAYITLARLSGIPSRLVGGYLGGEFNAFGGYYLVKEDNAHVWVEILTDDNHWVRVDPSQWAINAEAALQERRTAKLSALQQLIDNLNYQWTQGVLLFDFYRQLDFLRETRSTFRKLRSPDVELRYLFWVGPVLICFALGYILTSRKKLSPEARFVEELRMRLRRRYGDDAVSPASGLEELGERLDNEAARQFAKIYQGAVFRNRSLNAAERQRLKELLREI